MISAVFGRGGDVSFVAEGLKAVFDPRGGAWMSGRYVPSLLAAIGAIIERHMGGTTVEPGSSDRVRPQPERLAGQSCPPFSGASLIRVEGCNNCLDCGYSKCG